jgi:hypothetical protein
VPSTKDVQAGHPLVRYSAPATEAARPRYSPLEPLPLPPGGPAPGGSPDLDQILEEIAATLRLTPTQFECAEAAYGAVTEWLAADDSALAPYRPALYPQGSAALRTNNRPVGRNDHDVDVVCQLRVTGWDAMRVYDAIHQRLADHGVYRKMLERKDRCVRLNYARDFHLDIIPAEPAPRPDLRWGELAVRIPDRARAGWTPSNPAGYVRWFHHQAETARLTKAARDAAPLPRPGKPGDATVLALVVQLIKRYRDLRFAEPARAALAPRSVVLTTLAAMGYDGEQRTSVALHQVVTGMAAAVRAAWPSRVVIPNPTNPAERFCDKFTTDSYAEFVDFLLRLEAEVTAILAPSASGLTMLRPQFATLFGEEPVRKALVEYADRVAKAAREGRVRVSAGAGLTVVGAATDPGRVVPSHRFFGGTR